MILESQICQVNVGICSSLLAHVIFHGTLKWLSPNEPVILFCMGALVRLLMAETHHSALRLLESYCVPGSSVSESGNQPFLPSAWSLLIVSGNALFGGSGRVVCSVWESHLVVCGLGLWDIKVRKVCKLVLLFPSTCLSQDGEHKDLVWMERKGGYTRRKTCSGHKILPPHPYPGCSRMGLNIEERLRNLLESGFLWGADDRRPKWHGVRVVL